MKRAARRHDPASCDLHPSYPARDCPLCYPDEAMLEALEEVDREFGGTPVAPPRDNGPWIRTAPHLFASPLVQHNGTWITSLCLAQWDEDQRLGQRVREGLAKANASPLYDPAALANDPRRQDFDPGIANAATQAGRTLPLDHRQVPRNPAILVNDGDLNDMEKLMKRFGR